MSYDPSNIFAKILRGEIPCKKVFEDDYALAFHDINPQAPSHILVIPKGPYTTFDDFIGSADEHEIVGFYRAVGKAINTANIAATGYRLISNAGTDAHQDVPHYHVHIVGGRDLGAMLVHEKP
jgi:diadenosine tetraphosphate (Ap4A) HIT family hydrolase